MIPLVENRVNCFGCAACRAVCPTKAITMQPDREGFFYPVIDSDLCTQCGACTAVCPARQELSGEAGEPFAVRCKDLQILQKSSSGGAFTLLAQQVLEAGGLVCGAVFDKQFRVHHVLSDSPAPMRKAKYIQSDLQEIYVPIKTALEAGRTVLFTGTPCQCDGVRRYLGSQPEGLVLAALICRGVQSPGLWRDYAAWLAGDGTLEHYCFRDKRVKNDGHTVAWSVDGAEQAVSMNKDPFSRLYIKCLSLRPSCYHCPYTRWELPFDLTIGDFWGVEKVYPQLADGMGTSLVITRTPAGRRLLEGMKERAVVLPVNREQANQPALSEPAKEAMLRKFLFQDCARKQETGMCDIPLILKKYGG